MSINIKQKITEEFKNSTHNLPTNHRQRFETKLQNKLHKNKKRNYAFLKIVASFLILISVGIFTYTNTKTDKTEKQTYTLGSLSPELKKIENYYTNAITYELTQLEINAENKPILDQYFNKLAALTKQYKQESTQINIDKINEKTINALIDNLQMRLQLLLHLKEQLNRIKNKKDEKHTL